MKETTVGELASQIDGRVCGNENAILRGIATLESAGPRDLSFLTRPEYQEAARETNAGCIIVDDPEIVEGQNCIIVSDAQLGYVRAMQFFAESRDEFVNQGDEKCVAESAVLGANVSIGCYTYIGARTRIEEDTKIGPNVTIGENCQIGEGCNIHPGVVIYPNTVVGDRVNVHANAVIGGEGFGYYIKSRPVEKIPQMGKVIIDNDVDIGSCSCVDRATLDKTYIGPRTKIDNLVIVGHNVHIESDVLIIGQSGIAGSATLREGAELMGQTGIRGHTEVGENSRVLAKSFTFGSVEPDEEVGGIPAIPRSQWSEVIKNWIKLPEIVSRLKILEKWKDTLEEQ